MGWWLFSAKSECGTSISSSSCCCKKQSKTILQILVRIHKRPVLYKSSNKNNNPNIKCTEDTKLKQIQHAHIKTTTPRRNPITPQHPKTRIKLTQIPKRKKKKLKFHPKKITTHKWLNPKTNRNENRVACMSGRENRRVTRGTYINGSRSHHGHGGEYANWTLCQLLRKMGIVEREKERRDEMV